MSELPKIWTGEDELFATLLSVVQEACATMKENELNSWYREAYAHAMRLLAGAGFVEIQTDVDGCIIAHMTPDGATLLDRLHEQERQEALRVQQSDVAVEARKGRGDQIVAEIAAMPILDRRSTQEIIDDINEL
jgi:hypothetical protein